MAWRQPTSLEERLRELFVPAPLYIRYRLDKELRRGERELHLVPYLADPGRDAIDIGANKGVWTLQLSRYCRHVHAFEPNPKVYGWLKRYAPKRNVSTSDLALSDAQGTAELRIPRYERGYSNQHASLRALEGGEHGVVTVGTKRLDDFDFADVGFIKIDVEGHEASVLKGARETLRRCRPTLIVEMEERHTGRRIEDLIAEVEAYGYRALALTGHGLKEARSLDFEACHRRALGTRAYLNNFIFLPAA